MKRTAPPAKPPALKAGDTVGVVSAGRGGRANRRSSAASNWSTRSGFHARVSRHVLDRDDILAGSDRQRAEELQAFFADPDIRAIFVARGGYGSGPDSSAAGFRGARAHAQTIRRIFRPDVSAQSDRRARADGRLPRPDARHRSRDRGAQSPILRAFAKSPGRRNRYASKWKRSTSSILALPRVS